MRIIIKPYLLPLGLAFGACGGLGAIQLPVHSLAPGAAGLAFEGRLEVDGPCLFLLAGELELNLLWPPGYQMRPSTGDILDGDGVTIAKVGDEVTIEGSSTPNMVTPPGCQPRRGAAIGQLIEVNGERVSPTDKLPPGLGPAM